MKYASSYFSYIVRICTYSVAEGGSRERKSRKGGMRVMKEEAILMSLCFCTKGTSLEPRIQPRQLCIIYISPSLFSSPPYPLLKDIPSLVHTPGMVCQSHHTSMPSLPIIITQPCIDFINDFNFWDGAVRQDPTGTPNQPSAAHYMPRAAALSQGLVWVNDKGHFGTTLSLHLSCLL